MRWQVHHLGGVANGQPQAAVATRCVDRDVVHPALESVLVVRLAHHLLRDEWVVPDQELKPLLLAREQGHEQIIEIVAGLLGVLNRVNDEAVLEADRIFRIALAALEQVENTLKRAEACALKYLTVQVFDTLLGEN